MSARLRKGGCSFKYLGSNFADIQVLNMVDQVSNIAGYLVNGNLFIIFLNTFHRCDTSRSMILLGYYDPSKSGGLYG